MYRILIIALMVLSSCTKDNIIITNVDDRIQPYLDEFIADAKANGVNVERLNTQDLVILIKEELEGVGDGPTTAGLAWKMNREGVFIEIRESHWEESTELSRKWMLYHELGHDLFNLRHRDTGIMRTHTSTRLSGVSDFVWTDFFELAP